MMVTTTASPTIESMGNRIILHFDTLEHALRLLSPWRGAGPRADVASRIHQALQAVGLTVEVRVNGRAVAIFGDGIPHGALLTLLGLNPAESAR